jgi:hypothetical protein
MASQLIKIYEGKYVKHKSENRKKIFVFDLDETLGQFSDMTILWHALVREHVLSDSQQSFNELMDLFPEFLRIGIIPILEYLYQKKNRDECLIYMYTNNIYSPDIPKKIAAYLEYKIGGALFERVICAFKIGNKVIEPLRTTNDKTYSNLLQFVMMPRNVEVCFVDDQYHKKMVHNKVYYIQPLAYMHQLSPDTIIERTCVHYGDPHGLYNILSSLFPERPSMSPLDTETHIKVSQKLMYHVREFFHLGVIVPKTKKKRGSSVGGFTRKKKS